MSLLVSKQTSPGVYSNFSIDGAQTSPLTTIHHGRNGHTEELKLYLGREAGNTSTFTNVCVTPVTSGAADIGDPSGPGTTGWGVKVMIDPGHEPTEAEWDTVDYGLAAGPFADISTDRKLPFWFRIESPRGIIVQNKTNISLLITFTETP